MCYFLESSGSLFIEWVGPIVRPAQEFTSMDQHHNIFYEIRPGKLWQECHSCSDFFIHSVPRLSWWSRLIISRAKWQPAKPACQFWACSPKLQGEERPWIQVVLDTWACERLWGSGIKFTDHYDLNQLLVSFPIHSRLVPVVCTV